MSEKQTLSFYTNMPTPYQLDFFDALAKTFCLTVVYSSYREKDREWNLPFAGSNYDTVILKDNGFAKIVQRKAVSFHFDAHISQVLRSDRSDCVIVNGTYWSPNVILSLVLSFKHGKKVFFFSEPVFATSNPFMLTVKWILLSFVKNFTTGIFAVGKNAVASFKTYGYKKAIYNIPYNIDINKFEHNSLDNEKLTLVSEKYNANQKTLFLTSGSLIKRKGIDTVINAFKALPVENFKLLILGDGPDRTHLEEIAHGSGDIEFVGFIPTSDIPYFFSISSIFVFASRYDGWGLVINEAIAARLAIISSLKAGAAIDKLIHDHNALLFEPDDLQALSHDMYLLGTDLKKRTQLIANLESVRKSISSQYNAELVDGICRQSK